MSDVLQFPNRPIRWNRLRSDEAERVIRELARDTRKVTVSLHAYDRIEERTITQDDMYRILRSGHVEGSPERTEHGDWKIVIAKRMQGSREAGAVTVIVGEGESLFVVTVEWMDTLR